MKSADHADMFRFSSPFGEHVFLTHRSQIHDLAADGDFAIDAPRARLPLDVDKLHAPTALSLNVAQACNLACTYCYADQGRFQGRPAAMTLETAQRAIDGLIESAAPGASLLVGFMGGEPLLNRDLVHGAVRYAASAAGATGRSVRFSLTTNGTLVTDADAALFTDYPFTVQVSLDGRRDLNDRQRPTANGRGSYDRAIAGLSRLASRKPRSLSIRMTATPAMAGLKDELDAMLALGVDDAGFAPVLVSPSGEEYDRMSLGRFLEEMLVCGRAALAAALGGERYAFTNFEAAMSELHKGSHRPLPCGAGANYLSASAEGKLYACHRMVGDERAALGDIDGGLDQARRRSFLETRQVDAIEPCSSCWARYLCGGGCHHEVMHRGRISCDYIRGWLAFCLEAYVQLSEQAPATGAVR